MINALPDFEKNVCAVTLRFMCVSIVGFMKKMQNRGAERRKRVLNYPVMQRQEIRVAGLFLQKWVLLLIPPTLMQRKTLQHFLAMKIKTKIQQAKFPIGKSERFIIINFNKK